MYKGQNVNVIVPAYNEEELIQTMLSGVPEFIDGVIVIDDCSSDATNSLVEAAAVQEIRDRAVTVALAATEKLLEEKLADDPGANLIDEAITSLPNHLH